jgi:hypothetical protein
MKIAPAVLLLCLTGCQTTLDPNYAIQLESYRLTITSQQSVELAKARAEEARYNAMALIAERADGATKSMAILALALGGRGEVASRPVEVQLPRIPETQEDRALKWASVFAGPTTALVTSYFGYQLGKTQSNNQAATTQSSYAALVSMKPAQPPFVPTTQTINTITTNTDAWVTNRDGLVVVGGAQPTSGQQDNSSKPVVVVPPVVPIVPVVVTNP